MRQSQQAARTFSTKHGAKHAAEGIEQIMAQQHALNAKLQPVIDAHGDAALKPLSYYLGPDEAAGFLFTAAMQHGGMQMAGALPHLQWMQQNNPLVRTLVTQAFQYGYAAACADRDG